MNELFFTDFGLEYYGDEFSFYTEVNDIVLFVLVKYQQKLNLCFCNVDSRFEYNIDTINNFRISVDRFGIYIYYD